MVRQELIDKICNTLNPKYLNDVFTWAQIEEAILKATEPTDKSESMTLDQFEKIHPEYTEQVYVSQKQEWIPVSERDLSILEVRVKLEDGSEMNVWNQSDGDFLSPLLRAFIHPEIVTHWQPLPPKTKTVI